MIAYHITNITVIMLAIWVKVCPELLSLAEDEGIPS